MIRPFFPLLLTAALLLCGACSKRDAVLENSPNQEGNGALSASFKENVFSRDYAFLYPEEIQEGKVPTVTYADSSEDSAFIVVKDDSLDNYDDMENDPSSQDPLEGWNRFVFPFNDFVILHILKPVYNGYSWIVPKWFRTAVDNISNILGFPIRFANCLLQGRFIHAGVDFGQTMASLMSSGGLVNYRRDLKTRVPYNPEFASFNYTLSTWGVPNGPYFTLPVFGPRTLRGSIGFLGDMAADSSWDNPLPKWLTYYFSVNSADSLYRPYEYMTKTAVEPYVAVRNAIISRSIKKEEQLAKYPSLIFPSFNK